MYSKIGKFKRNLQKSPKMAFRAAKVAKKVKFGFVRRLPTVNFVVNA